MDYTIAGYYENNGRPFVGFAAAETPDEAIDTVVRLVNASGDSAYELVVLSVFEGQHQDLRAGEDPLYVGDAKQFEDMFE